MNEITAQDIGNAVSFLSTIRKLHAQMVTAVGELAFYTESSSLYKGLLLSGEANAKVNGLLPQLHLTMQENADALSYLNTLMSPGNYASGDPYWGIMLNYFKGQRITVGITDNTELINSYNKLIGFLDSLANHQGQYQKQLVALEKFLRMVLEDKSFPDDEAEILLDISRACDHMTGD